LEEIIVEIPESLIEKLKKSTRVTFLTGAGISAESGIKTFRDPDGLWSKLNPQELASMDGFLANPELVWSWYQERRSIIDHSKPNPGHYAIAEMQGLFPNFTLVTQNVDRLHQKAGSTNVVELHGNIIDNHCARCGKPYLGDTITNDGKLPKCTYCGGMIRPSVVWFGEMLPEDAIEKAEEASGSCDVFFSVGTSAEVYPAANMPIIAIRNGAYVVEVNPNTTALSSYVHQRIQASSGVAMPEIMRLLREFRGE
jgi:NAD-dependent deacetylase